MKAFRCKDWVGKDVVLVRKVRTNDGRAFERGARMRVVGTWRGRYDLQAPEPHEKHRVDIRQCQAHCFRLAGKRKPPKGFCWSIVVSPRTQRATFIFRDVLPDYIELAAAKKWHKMTCTICGKVRCGVVVYRLGKSKRSPALYEISDLTWAKEHGW